MDVEFSDPLPSIIFHKSVYNKLCTSLADYTRSSLCVGECYVHNCQCFSAKFHWFISCNYKNGKLNIRRND